MGQLLGLPISTDNGFSDDKRPKNVSECYVNGKLKRKRFQQYQKRSNDESRRVLVDLLFSKSPLVLVDDDNENNGSEGADEQQPPGAEEVVFKFIGSTLLLLAAVDCGICRQHGLE